MMLFPYGIYDTKRCLLTRIGLYRSELDCYRDNLYRSRETEPEKIKSKAREQGFVVVPLDLSYKIPEECE